MFRRSLSYQRQFTFTRVVVLCAVLFLTTLAAFNTGAPRSQTRSQRQSLTFEDRVAAQRAIEAVYHRHRIWPTDNPQPKPALDDVLSEAALRAKVAEYLRQSNALAQVRRQPLTADELQAEVARMARQTRQPEVLAELWAALGGEPFVIAECLAQPLLAERLLREAEEKRDEGGGVKDETNTNLSSPHPFEAMDAPEFAYRLPEMAAVAAPV